MTIALHRVGARGRPGCNAHTLPARRHGTFEGRCISNAVRSSTGSLRAPLVSGVKAKAAFATTPSCTPAPHPLP